MIIETFNITGDSNTNQPMVKFKTSEMDVITLYNDGHLTNSIYWNDLADVFNIDKIAITKIMQYQSGGGCNHLFLHCDNSHIISIHLPFGDIELSYSQYDSIDVYLNDMNNGFGFEYTYPNYEKRNTNLFEIL